MWWSLVPKYPQWGQTCVFLLLKKYKNESGWGMANLRRKRGSTPNSKLVKNDVNHTSTDFVLFLITNMSIIYKLSNFIEFHVFWSRFHMKNQHQFRVIGSKKHFRLHLHTMSCLCWLEMSYQSRGDSLFIKCQ